MLAVWLVGLRNYLGAAMALACVVSTSAPTSQHVADLILGARQSCIFGALCPISPELPDNSDALVAPAGEEPWTSAVEPPSWPESAEPTGQALDGAAYAVPPSTGATQAAPGSSASDDAPPPGALPAPSASDDAPPPGALPALSSQSRAQSETVPAPAAAGTGGAAAPAPDGGPEPGVQVPAAPGGSSGSTGGAAVPVPIDGDGTMTAAQRYGWGSPARVDDFTAGLGQWSIYNGPGHAGNGLRSPNALTVQNGVLTISGDARGTTGGMRWDFGSTYGRWEGRMRAPVSDPTYNAVMLLWPDAEDFPVGGEIDFVEMLDHTRQEVNGFVHYGADNRQVNGKVRIDATQWHNWAVEWTPAGITTFVDGQPWWSTTDTAILPPRSMHLCLQLDWFPDGGGAAVTPSQMFVDWVAFYPLAGGTTVPPAPVTPRPTSLTPTTPTTPPTPPTTPATPQPSTAATTPPAAPTTTTPPTTTPTTASSPTASPAPAPTPSAGPNPAPATTTASQPARSATPRPIPTTRPVPTTTPAPSSAATRTQPPMTSSGSPATTTSGR